MFLEKYKGGISYEKYYSFGRDPLYLPVSDRFSVLLIFYVTEFWITFYTEGGLCCPASIALNLYEG